MIFRFVSTRHSSPLSMRATVSADTPALRASSAFVRSWSSRSFRTLFGARRGETLRLLLLPEVAIAAEEILG